MEKTPEETKRGLKVCHSAGRVLAKELWCEKQCPYMDEAYGCGEDYLHADALTYIQQLEAANAELLTKVEQLEAKCHQLERERDAAVADLEHVKDCDSCKYDNECITGKKDCFSCHEKSCPCMTCKYEWRGVKEG